MKQSSQPSCCQQQETIVLPSYPGSACCGGGAGETRTGLPRLGQGFVIGSVSTPAGSLPRVSSELQWRDRWGAVKARWGVGRMDYAVDPGLYALGNPHRESPVLVSANYKMSFDELRSALPGRDLWILALDTKGINVWCAAGKGTFGTEELVGRIESSGLKEVVGHRSLILPQLGAPGVAAHTVKKLSGFGVRYGPIKAEDLPAYIDAGFKATSTMRLKTFPFKERAVLIPIELIETIKPTLIIAPLLFLLGGIGGPAGFWANALHDGSFAVLAFLSAIVGGAVIHPLLLPYLPGRAFSAKGLVLGAVVAVIMLTLQGYDPSMWAGRLGILAWLLIIPAVTAFLAMNFTGASTYTSLSGVNKEMRWALPTEIGMGLSGLIIWVASRLIA
ncbi:MAG: acetyl-CoA synthase subunit gamma [Proteobacteria bacterium]|nr:acetyl-CoA synthase subunit gamma [Pseudomonadota bacterium]